jgi:hypothetical protein
VHDYDPAPGPQRATVARANESLNDDGFGSVNEPEELDLARFLRATEANGGDPEATASALETNA